MTDPPRRPGVWLDHVTLRVPDFAQAETFLRERFGLVVTPTTGAALPHGRIMLHHSYIEVTEATAEHGQDELALTGFYLGHADVPDAVARLAAVDLAAGEPMHYLGVDGVWWDGPLAAPDGVPAPVLVQRLTPREVAGDWPPPLTAPHPSGAVALGSVYLVTPYVAQAVAFFEGLAATLDDEPEERAHAHMVVAGAGLPADRRWEIGLSGGGDIVVCDPLRHGFARGHLAAHGAGILGIELLTADVAGSRAFLEGSGVALITHGDARAPVLWLDPAATPGLLLSLRDAGDGG